MLRFSESDEALKFQATEALLQRAPAHMQRQEMYFSDFTTCKQMIEK